MRWDCLRGLENYSEVESFGPLGGWVLCWGPMCRGSGKVPNEAPKAAD